MKTRSWIGVVALLSIIAIGGLVISSTPELEINVSSTAGYQGQADVAVDPLDALTLVVAGTDGGGSGPTVWSSDDGNVLSFRIASSVRRPYFCRRFGTSGCS